MTELIEFLCPICKIVVPKSGYLHSVFTDDPWTEYAACLVTHYRHNHLRYYDRSRRCWAYRNKNPEYTNHDDFKAIVNNRAKRQLIRAAVKKFERTIAIKLIQGFSKLQYNDEATNELIEKTITIKQGELYDRNRYRQKTLTG